MQKHKAFFNWSTGKDAALALYYLLKDDVYQVDHLLTTVNAHYDRVSMHGLRRELLELQAKSIGIPALKALLPEQPTMDEYAAIMMKVIMELKSGGCTHAAFGDIFLEDLKKYRESQFQKMGIELVFPIWQKDTKSLIEEFLSLGFKAVIVAAKAAHFDESFVGTMIDHSFLNNLPANVDPCGENGEFHTFCFDGPIFDHPISYDVGEKIYREYDAPGENESDKKMGFWFCDLLPK